MKYLSSLPLSGLLTLPRVGSGLDPIRLGSTFYGTLVVMWLQKPNCALDLASEKNIETTSILWSFLQLGHLIQKDILN